jgi:hypothetical protein
MELGSAGQWFSGIVSFAVLFYYMYRDYVDAPKLMFTFDNERDVAPQSRTTWPGGRHDTGSQWLRVRVTNEASRKVAKNCRAFLVGIKTSRGEIPPDWIPHDCRQLRWTHDHSTEPAGRDLLPRMSHWIDVATSFDTAKHVQLHCFPSTSLKVPGEYLLKIQVSAEGVESSAVAEIRIFWDGTNWRSLRGEHVYTHIIDSI